MSNFFQELKRRNVFRVGIAYAIVGWLLVQVTANAVPAFSMPPWVNTVVFYFILIGFPLALLFAWAYELTPEGLKKIREVKKHHSVALKTGRKIDFIIIGALLVALGYFIWERQTGGPVSTEETEVVREASIAVLPFADLSAKGDQEYFGDGIAEEILNVLAKIPEMKVTGRTSSFQFKGQNPDLRAIGEKLNVDHILEGSIRKDGDRIRITVQLVAADDGFHLWSATYNRELGDIFAIQDQISTAVVEALKIRLAESTGGLVKPETSNFEAYNLYLQARQLLHQRGADNIEMAAKLFEAVTVLDPEFSRAWSAQARAYGLLPFYFYMIEAGDFVAFLKKGKKAADKALELDPDNAEAYSALSGINLGMYEWWEAEINNAKAMALAPNDAEIANFIGDHYQILFDTVNAVKWEGRAYELDPLHQVNSRELAFAYLRSGDFENALKFASVAVDLAPEGVFNLQVQIYALSELGRFEEAHEIINQWKASLRYDPFIILDGETYLFIREGRVEEARANLEKMGQLVLAGDGISFFLFQHFLELGDIETGLFWYEKAFQERNPFISSVRGAGNFLPENYTDDPELIARFELPGMKELFEIRRRNIAKNAAKGSE